MRTKEMKRYKEILEKKSQNTINKKKLKENNRDETKWDNEKMKMWLKE